MQLVDDLNEKRGCWTLKEEVVYITTSSVMFSPLKTFLSLVLKSTPKKVKRGFQVYLFHQTSKNIKYVISFNLNFQKYSIC